MRHRLVPRFSFAACFAVVALSGCDQSVTLDLAVTGTDALSSVVLPVSNVHLLDESGTTLFSRTPDADVSGNLLDFGVGETVELVSIDDLAEGTYTGLALSFDQSRATITGTDGNTFAVTMSDTMQFADTDLDVTDTASLHFLIVLDLRFSVSNQTGTLGSYYVRPNLRIVDRDNQGSIGGSVSAVFVESDDCRAGRPTTQGVAVYVYSGSVTAPGDFEAGSTSASSPIASAAVADSNGSYAFSMPYLSPGTFTLAVTCQGDQEDPLTDQGLSFSSTQTVTVVKDQETSVALP